jgi:ferrous iron transport protein A
MEMGLIEGELVRLLGKAPLGEPLEFAFRGSRLSLRKTEAFRVRIEVLKDKV